MLLSLLSNKDASFVLVIHKDYQQQQQQNEKVDREYKTNKQTKNIGFYPIKMVIIMIIMMVVVVVKEFLDNFFGSDSNNYYETNKKFVKTFSFSLLKWCRFCVNQPNNKTKINRIYFGPNIHSLSNMIDLNEMLIANNNNNDNLENLIFLFIWKSIFMDMLDAFHSGNWKLKES